MIFHSISFHIIQKRTRNNLHLINNYITIILNVNLMHHHRTNLLASILLYLTQPLINWPIHSTGHLPVRWSWNACYWNHMCVCTHRYLCYCMVFVRKKVVVVGVCLILLGTLPLDFRLTCGHQLTITTWLTWRLSLFETMSVRIIGKWIKMQSCTIWRSSFRLHNSFPKPYGQNMLIEVLCVYCWDVPWGSIPQQVNVAVRSLTWNRGVPGSIPAKNQLFWLIPLCGFLDQPWDKPKVTFRLLCFFPPRFTDFWLRAFHCYMTSAIISLWTVFAEIHNKKNIL
jgi:hypothetical protein